MSAPESEENKAEMASTVDSTSSTAVDDTKKTETCAPVPEGPADGTRGDVDVAEAAPKAETSEATSPDATQTTAVESGGDATGEPSDGAAEEKQEMNADDEVPEDTEEAGDVQAAPEKQEERLEKAEEGENDANKEVEKEEESTADDVAASPSSDPGEKDVADSEQQPEKAAESKADGVAASSADPELPLPPSAENVSVTALFEENRSLRVLIEEQRVELAALRKEVALLKAGKGGRLALSQSGAGAEPALATAGGSRRFKAVVVVSVEVTDEETLSKKVAVTSATTTLLQLASTVLKVLSSTGTHGTLSLTDFEAVTGEPGRQSAPLELHHTVLSQLPMLDPPNRLTLRRRRTPAAAAAAAPSSPQPASSQNKEIAPIAPPDDALEQLTERLRGSRRAVGTAVAGRWSKERMSMADVASVVLVQRRLREWVRRSQQRRLRHRGDVVSELLSTERNYASGLSDLARTHHTALVALDRERAAGDDSDSELSPAAPLLQCAKAMAHVALRVQQALERAVNGAPSAGASLVGTAFCELLDDAPRLLARFAPYCATYERRVAMLRQRARTDAAVRKVMRTTTAALLDAEDLLISPVQRVGRYVLLFQQLFESTPCSHDDYAASLRAYRAARSLATYCDQMRSDYDTLRSTLSSVAPLAEPLLLCGRRLLHEGVIFDHRGVARHAFLLGGYDRRQGADPTVARELSLEMPVVEAASVADAAPRNDDPVLLECKDMDEKEKRSFMKALRGPRRCLAQFKVKRLHRIGIDGGRLCDEDRARERPQDAYPHVQHPWTIGDMLFGAPTATTRAEWVRRCTAARELVDAATLALAPADGEVKQ